MKKGNLGSIFAFFIFRFLNAENGGIIKEDIALPSMGDYGVFSLPTSKVKFKIKLYHLDTDH